MVPAGIDTKHCNNMPNLKRLHMSCGLVQKGVEATHPKHRAHIITPTANKPGYVPDVHPVLQNLELPTVPSNPVFRSGSPNYPLLTLRGVQKCEATTM